MKSRMVVKIVLLIIGALIILPEAGLTEEVYVFGPKTYIRETGKPREIIDSFSVTNHGTYKIVIQNGTGKINRISSAVIKVNDEIVVAPNEFNQRVEQIVKPVTLKRSNTISAEVRSIPESFIIVTILGEKPPAPAPTRIIEFATANPDGIFVNKPTPITVTAQIVPVPDLLPDTVKLLRLNERGEIISTLGYLRDGGTGGDRLPGDSIFTLQISLTEAQPQTVWLQVSASYRNPPTQGLSNVFTIDVVSPITEASFQQMIEIESAAKEQFETFKSLTQNEDLARQKTVEWLKKQQGVLDAGISPDGFSIWILFENGLEGGILTYPVGTKGSTSTSGAPESYVTSTSSNAIVLAPFFDVFSPMDESDHIAQKLSQTCIGQPDVLKNEAVTVNVMKTISSYGVVSISSHGSLLSDGRVVILTRESANLINFSLHTFDLLTGRIKIIDGYYAITPSFITHYGRIYPKSLVYASSCSSLANDTMAIAFLGKGAYDYFGYSDTVNTSFSFPVGTTFFDHLVDDDMTTGQAYTALRNLGFGMPPRDPIFPNALFLFMGGIDLKLLEELVRNGSFETGDLTGWTSGYIWGCDFPFYGAPGGYAIAISGNAVDGSFAARLGRWDQIYTSGLYGPPSPGSHLIYPIMSKHMTLRYGIGLMSLSKILIPTLI